jgi:formate C-acetyltransferase
MAIMTDDWQRLLDRSRRDNFKDRTYDLCRLWRALAFREQAPQGGATAPQSEAMARAAAFQAVLDHLEVEPDEGLLLGNCRGLTSRGFTGDSLPTAGGEADYHTLMEELDARGQRDFWAGFDHALADYPTLLAVGVGGLRRRIQESLARHPGPEAQDFLHAAGRTLDAFSRFIRRLAGEARRAGQRSAAATCAAVANQPPRTFREALQLVWLTHLVFKTEGRCHMALGRLDQYLWPFYARDLQQGRLTRLAALDLLCHLWARLDEIGEVQNICIGGLTPAGDDATNDLSFLCLEATARVGSPHTNLSARFHDRTPEAFHRACFETIRTGIGFPAIFNDHVLIPGLEELGVPIEAARDYAMVGCIETMLPGRQPPWSDSRFNTPAVLLEAMHLLAAEPQPTYERLTALFRQALSRALQAHVDRVNAHIARFPPDRFPDPFLSALTRDCLGQALDIHAGGAEFPRFHGICIMGLATLADSLAAVKKLVFEERAVAYADLMAALDRNFAGAEPLRQRLLHQAPKYGNDDPYVDGIAAQVVAWTAGECLRHRVVGGGRFLCALAANIQNIAAGREIGATPDGRQAHTPLSDAASPYFGRDASGPTAFLRSVAVPDYGQVLAGSVINMRFDPEPFRDEAGAQRFLAFTRYFVARRIPELQFNFTSNETLLAARRDPESYRSLVVRVSGFSARFVDLAPDVQDDILRRRAHG